METGRRASTACPAKMGHRGLQTTVWKPLYPMLVVQVSQRNIKLQRKVLVVRVALDFGVLVPVFKFKITTLKIESPIN